MTEEEYKRIMEPEKFAAAQADAARRYPLLGERVQINYYYDTAALEYQARGITVRIRQTEKGCALQIKRPLDAGAFKRSAEYAYPSGPPAARILLPGGGEPLCRMGSLTTARVKYGVKGELELCFDRSFYLGRADHEVELEFRPERAEEAAEAWAALGFGPEGPSRGKAERFFAALQCCAADQLPHEGALRAFLRPSLSGGEPGRGEDLRRYGLDEIGYAALCTALEEAFQTKLEPMRRLREWTVEDLCAALWEAAPLPL